MNNLTYVEEVLRRKIDLLMGRGYSNYDIRKELINWISTKDEYGIPLLDESSREHLTKTLFSICP